MLYVNYFIHSSRQLDYSYPTLGIDPTLRLSLEELGFELDCLAPDYSALATFPFCSPPQSRGDEDPIYREGK